MVTGTSKIFAGILDNIVELSIVQPEIPLPPLGEVIFTGDVSNRLYWLVCDVNVETRIVYLITKDIIKKVQWSTTDTISGGYEASNIKKECDLFLNEYKLNDISGIIDTGVGKVFIPTREQMLGESGGFSYFDSNSKRVANYNGTVNWYWTATPRDSSDVYGVHSGGNVYNTYYGASSGGFRPCICIQY